jgi:hypothetical protein
VRPVETTLPDSSTARLYLSHHVHCARVEGQLVFLDLRADRYSSLAPGESDAVMALAGADPGRAADRSDDAGAHRDDVAVDEVGRALTEAALLTPDPGRGRPIAPPSPLPLDADLMGYPLGRGPDIRAGHVARFAAAASTTAARLRWRSLVDIVDRVRARKRGRAERVDGDRLAELVEIYKRLRPLLFTTRGHCLHDSLVLVEFLAAHGVYPRWVIGVRMGPFAAHSWVQAGGVVLNDAVANAARYTPILAV